MLIPLLRRYYLLRTHHFQFFLSEIIHRRSPLVCCFSHPTSLQVSSPEQLQFHHIHSLDQHLSPSTVRLLSVSMACLVCGARVIRCIANDVSAEWSFSSGAAERWGEVVKGGKVGRKAHG